MMNDEMVVPLGPAPPALSFFLSFFGGAWLLGHWRTDPLFLNLRSSEIHLFYNLGDFYWHFLEILWLFIFLVLYFY